MDQIIEKILKKYRDYRERLKSSLDMPLPAAGRTLALSVFAIATLATGSVRAADAQIPYYGDNFYSAVYAGLHDDALVRVISAVLESGHRRRQGQLDEITSSCDAASKDCYGHVSVGYTTARKALMGMLHLQGNPGNYYIHDVYCEHDYTSADFTQFPPAPRQAPDDKVINTEHTWPQSRFNPRMNKDAQKSDLHHLFPTDSEINRDRGNLWFAEVDTPMRELRCSTVKLGSAPGLSGDYFEPPAAHKGNVARALFYFSIRYHLEISDGVEAYLRKWNKEDPVDAFEAARNDAIMRIQGNRNPFVDYPGLADLISNF